MKGYVPKLAFVKATNKKTAYFSPFYGSLTPKAKKYDIPALSYVSYMGPFDAQHDRVRYKGVYGYLPKTAFAKVYKIAQKNTAIYTPALGDPVGEIPVGTNLQILKEQRTLYTVLYKGKPTLAAKSHIDGIKNYVRIKKLLSEYLNGELISQIQSIKGIYYTPIYTSGKMLVVENAMRTSPSSIHVRGRR